jgi:hypothetical protein
VPCACLPFSSRFSYLWFACSGHGDYFVWAISEIIQFIGQAGADPDELVTGTSIETFDGWEALHKLLLGEDTVSLPACLLPTAVCN